MLTEINLENFKCFRQLNLRPKLITLLIGVNGSGKSSCTQALVLLKQSLGNDSLVTKGKYLQLGEYIDIPYGRVRTRRVKIGIASDTVIQEPPDKFPFDANVRYSLGVELLEGKVSRQDCEITSPLKLTSRYSDGKSSVTPPTIDLLDMTYGLRANERIGQPVVISREDIRPGVTPDPDRVRISKQSIRKLLNVFIEALSSIFLIPAIRGFDTDWYVLGDSAVVDLAENTRLEIRAQQLATTLAYRMELGEILSEWFTKITDINVRIKLVEQKRVELRAGVRKQAFNIVNEGFGSNQLVFALAQLAISPSYSTICYEEPEIHLHPRAQSKLTNVLVNVAKQENKQIMITTHSEHILYGFLANVAEGNLSPDELSIWYFDKKNGEVEQPQELPVDKKGRIEGGLRGFFEVELEQLERYFKALQKER